MKIKKKYKLKYYKNLKGNFTQVANTMFKHIPNGSYYKVYVYLCYRYNPEYEYAFPSIRTISKDTCLNVSTVQRAIKWLKEKKFIHIYTQKETSNGWVNNCYYIRYVEEDREQTQDEVVNTFEQISNYEFEDEIEIEEIIDVEDEDE